MAKGTKITLEERFSRLEEVVENLSSEDISLEDAFNSYSEGMKLVKECNAEIDRLEKKVMKLEKDGSLTELDNEDE
ncbi:MAG: exodeoxyribonuclease VII small subunit [Lachnospiraceae bacterium]|nr:exodeoxyribonuclease VII small subunit [Lachnospiraceae bacterium]